MPYNPWHFYAGTKARLNAGLKSQVYGDANLTEYKVGTDDPTVTAQNMPKGSIYIDTNTMRAWQKMDAGSTTNFRTLRADEWTKEATGFVDPDNTTVTYDTTNRTITLSHASGTVTFLMRGRKFAYASPWTVPTVLGGATPIAHTNANGSYFLKIDPDTLAVSFDTVPWSFSDLMICFAYKSATAQFALREVHGLLPWQAHEELHSTQGTYIKSATVSADYVPVGGVGYSTSDSNQNRPSIAQQTVYDEDIPTVVLAWPDNGPYTLLYAGATTPVFLTGQLDIFPVSGGGVAQYDLNGVLTDVAEDAYFNVLTMHLPVTADAASQAFRTIFVIGQTTYTTQAAAQAAVPASWNLSGLGGQVTEYVSSLLWTFQENSTGSGSVTKRGTARLMADPTRFVGTRSSQIAASGISPTDHQALSNRSAADAHPDTSITATGSYTGTLAGVTTVGGALTTLDGLKTLLTTAAVRASNTSGLSLQNSAGDVCLLLGPGSGGLNATFYDGVNITGVLDQASASTMQIGINNATAITIGKAGITTTNAGAFTSSQLLTASLGVTLGGGTAANGKIWYGSSAIQFGNNVGSVSDAGAWTFPTNTVHKFGSTGTNTATQVQINTGTGAGRFAQLDLYGGSSRYSLVFSDTNTTGYTANSLAFYNGSAYVGDISSAGAWTLGSGTFANQTHEIKGNISSGGTGTSDESRSIVIGANYSSSGVQGPLTTRTTSLSGTFIRMTPRTSDSLLGFSVNTNLVTSGTETNIAYATVAGAWTFPVNTTHIFGSAAGGTGNTLLVIRSQTTTGGDTRLAWDTIGSSSLWVAGCDKDSATTWKLAYNSNADFESNVFANCTSAGAWTLGPSSGLTASHTIQAGTSTGFILNLNNTDAAANATLIRCQDAGATLGSFGSTTSYILDVFNASNTRSFSVPSGLGNGTLTLTGAVVGVSSDARLKTLTENQEIPGLNAICSITPARYRWNNPDLGDDVHLGFIAQDVQPHIPEAVGKPGGDGMLGFYDRPVLAASVKAIQELASKLDAEKARNDLLEARLAQVA